MFIDYYALLEINENSSIEDIKSAFKKMALKWHPDRNPGTDTTRIMQEINEAYLILKDFEARKRYNLEYIKFIQYKKETKQNTDNTFSQRKPNSSDKNQKENTYEYYDYKVDDQILEKWIHNAKKQAIIIAKQTIEDLRGMINVGTKTAIKESGEIMFYYIIISAIFFILIAASKSCHN
jgi:curved DNA-binding protein CbpA